MDATRLPPAGESGPAPEASRPAGAGDDAAATVLDGLKAIAGRFLVQGAPTPTPTGDVFGATDSQGGGATVQLKLVAAAVLPNAGMADRALRELKQLGKVTSDRILKVVDHGKTESGQVYVATEVPEGSTLEALVAREGALSVERATAIALQIGEALTEAQKVGVIHRDVAPRNVWIGPNDRVKVGEFGLAEPVSDKVFGAPAYLSPEQVEGKPVDQRSNIYSLAATYYFALTGQPPFLGDVQAVLHAHANQTPQPPSAKRPGLPQEIDRIVLKALEKSGGRRHLTLRQLLSELEAAAGHATVAAAKTVLGMEAPRVTAPPPQAPPSATPVHTARPMAATMMGIPSPLKAATAPTMMAAAPVTAPSAPAAQPTPAPPPVQAQASQPQPAPAQPAQPIAEAKTVMAEAPKPAAATPVAEAKTVMAEAPKQPAPAAAPARNVPVNASPEVQAAVAAAQAKLGAQPQAEQKKGGFRETGWFKVGEIEEARALAEARAAQASGGDVLAPTGTTGQQPVVDPDQVEISAADKARLSLKTGATQMMQAVRPTGPISDEQMDEKEMLAEMDNSRRWFIIAGAALGVVIVGVLLWLLFGRSGDAAKAEAPPQKAPEAVAASPPEPAPPSPPPPATPPPPQPEPESPTPTASAALLAEAEGAASKGDFARAVERLQKAAKEGADVRRLSAQLQKQLEAQAARAKKPKERNEAKALLAKLKAAKPAAAKAGKKR